MADVEITVRGSHHAKAAPERANVRARVVRDGPDPEQVIGDAATIAERVRDAVTRLHDPEAGPVVTWSSDRMQTWSSRPWNQDGVQLPLVHHAQLGYDVEFSDFTVLGRWLSDIAVLDGVVVDGVEWALTDDHRDALLREVRAEAVADARAKAEVYAEALGLGRVTVLAVADAGMLGDGIHPVSGGDGTPRGRAYAMAASAPEVEFEPRPIRVTADVDARFLAG